MKIFLLTILLFLVHSEIIFQDYGKGNRGSGISNQVEGANNTWIGNSNNLTGDLNQIKGNENRVKGSNNIVEGNNNVIGDVSPQELAQMQNQMFANLQDRFKGIFNFPKIPNRSIDTQVISPPQQDKQTESFKSQANTNSLKINNESSKSQQQKKAQKEIVIQPKKEPHLTQISLNETASSQVVSQVIPALSPNVVAQKINQTISSILLFRSFGNSVNNLNEAYFTQGILEDTKNYLCQRWNYCNEKDSSRMFFSSIYPSFPLA